MKITHSLFIPNRKVRAKWLGESHQCEWSHITDSGHERYQCQECGKFRMIYGDYEVSEERELDFDRGE
jgi:hypothetical protein